MRRRKFIALASATVAWPTITRAQQLEGAKRVGFLTGLTEGNADGRARLDAFEQRLTSLGWIIGKTVKIEKRWATPGDLVEMRNYARELVASGCDVILVNGTRALMATQAATSTTPIVIAHAVNADVFGASLTRPTGNATGLLFSQADMPTVIGKSIQLLLEIAPNLKRLVLLISDNNPERANIEEFIKSVAKANRLEPAFLAVSSREQIQAALRTATQDPDTGLYVASDVVLEDRPKPITELATQLKLPAIFSKRLYVDEGGLMSYGSNELDFYRSAATYVDRVLRGAKPVDLPVQQPTRYELIINAKTARTLGLTVPTTFLATADEVIE